MNFNKTLFEFNKPYTYFSKNIDMTKRKNYKLKLTNEITVVLVSDSSSK